MLTITVSCTATQPSTVVAPSGWPEGWSADGSQLLIGEYDGGPPRVINLSDNSTQQQVSSALARIHTSCLAWTSDGKTVLYIEPDPRFSGPNVTHKLYRLDLPQQQSLLWEWAGDVSCPTWSPDNQQIAVVAVKKDQDTLYILDQDGHTKRTLLTASMIADPAWSSNGQMIAFTSYGKVLLINSETGEKVNTSAFPRAGVEPTWSPTGEYIAYIEPDMFRSIRFGNLVIAKTDGTRTIMLAGAEDKASPKDDEFFYLEPLWSPRGDYIAARRIRATEHDFPDYLKYEVVLVPVPGNLK